jgi:hypothetical protein
MALILQPRDRTWRYLAKTKTIIEMNEDSSDIPIGTPVVVQIAAAKNGMGFPLTEMHGMGFPLTEMHSAHAYTCDISFDVSLEELEDFVPLGKDDLPL